ncbi:MAG: hypothetical protein FWB80_13720 [Defluviitaleaceae bacterium]|nr:hypothetical protein [Defluviitaleaceae bacterium]
MYEILQNPKRMLIQEIDNSFDGKWVYIVHCEKSEGNKTIAGVPVVIADGPFEGVEEGIYNQYKDGAYGETLSYTLLPSLNFYASLSR